MAWVKKADDTSVGHILSSAATTHESFLVNDSNELTAGHGGVLDKVSVAYPTDNDWHHVAVTYEPTSTTMKLYLNGELVDTNTVVTQRTLADLRAFGYTGGNALIGLVDDLRLYSKALSINQIKEIYRLSIL
jgi:hypothetical protein